MSAGCAQRKAGDNMQLPPFVAQGNGVRCVSSVCVCVYLLMLNRLWNSAVGESFFLDLLPSFFLRPALL